MRIRKGDKVKVISGPDKGTVARISAIDRESGKVTVEGLSLIHI